MSNMSPNYHYNESYKASNGSLPPAINLDGTLRKKQDPHDYGLTSSDAEIEYYDWLEELRDA